jgi:hypothetical protein
MIANIPPAISQRLLNKYTVEAVAGCSWSSSEDISEQLALSSAKGKSFAKQYFWRTLKSINN